MRDGETILDLLVRGGFVASKAEARRLIENGAVEIVPGERLADPRAPAPRGRVLRVGKRRFLHVR